MSSRLEPPASSRPPLRYSHTTTDDGTIEKWSVGGPSTTRMAANGWGKDSLRMGDVITGTGYRFADGQRILRLKKIVMPDGKVKLLYGR